MSPGDWLLVMVCALQLALGCQSLEVGYQLGARDIARRGMAMWGMALFGMLVLLGHR